MLSAKTGAAPEASNKNATKIILTIVFFMFFSLMDFDFQKVNFRGIGPGTYCTEQGLGQHMGLGMLSALAKMGAAPEASSKNVTKIILTIVFFMFLSCG